MDPFAQQIQRIESNDKVQQLVEALRLIPIDDAEARDQLETSLKFENFLLNYKLSIC